MFLIDALFADRCSHICIFIKARITFDEGLKFCKSAPYCSRIGMVGDVVSLLDLLMVC